MSGKHTPPPAHGRMRTAKEILQKTEIMTVLSRRYSHVPILLDPRRIRLGGRAVHRDGRSALRLPRRHRHVLRLGAGRRRCRLRREPSGPLSAGPQGRRSQSGRSVPHRTARRIFRLRPHLAPGHPVGPAAGAGLPAPGGRHRQTAPGHHRPAGTVPRHDPPGPLLRRSHRAGHPHRHQPLRGGAHRGDGVRSRTGGRRHQRPGHRHPGKAGRSPGPPPARPPRAGPPPPPRKKKGNK